MYTMEEVNGTWRTAFSCANALFDYLDTMMKVAGGAVKWAMMATLSAMSPPQGKNTLSGGGM